MEEFLKLHENLQKNGIFKDCKVQKIVALSFLLRFKEAVQDCKELRTP